MSDLHNAEFEENNERLLGLLSKTEPDIIVITGDLVDAQHTNIITALDFAKEVVRIAPAYYVTGNHEASLSQYSTLKAGLEAAGVVVLEDEAIQLERKSEAIQSIFHTIYEQVPWPVLPPCQRESDTYSHSSGPRLP